MAKDTICPSCGAKNDTGAERCVQCGTSLALEVSTLRVSDLTPEEVERLEKVRRQHSTKLETDSVAFFVSGDTRRPVIVKGKKRITLGRGAPNRPPPTVDLNPYRGFVLGVSRRHAVITRSDAGDYMLEDLGSTNGTWVNEEKIPPLTPHSLRSGDRIVLGQLTLSVYFRKR